MISSSKFTVYLKTKTIRRQRRQLTTLIQSPDWRWSMTTKDDYFRLQIMYNGIIHKTQNFNTPEVVPLSERRTQNIQRRKIPEVYTACLWWQSTYHHFHLSESSLFKHNNSGQITWMIITYMHMTPSNITLNMTKTT